MSVYQLQQMPGQKFALHSDVLVSMPSLEICVYTGFNAQFRNLQNVHTPGLDICEMHKCTRFMTGLEICKLPIILDMHLTVIRSLTCMFITIVELHLY